MIAHARSMEHCFLWVFWPHAEQPSDGRLEVIAACYDALGASAVLCELVLGGGDGLPKSEKDLLNAFSFMAGRSGWSGPPQEVAGRGLRSPPAAGGRARRPEAQPTEHQERERRA